MAIVFFIVGLLYLLKKNNVKEKCEPFQDYSCSSKTFTSISEECLFYKPLFFNKYEVELFIAPKGNDSNVGTRESPLASLEKSRDIIRLLKQTLTNRNKHYIVTLLEGTYYPSKTFLLNTNDGGLKDNPIVYRGEAGKQVVFDGGVNIDKINIEKVKRTTPEFSKLDSAARSQIIVVNLQKCGIKDYGQISYSGFYIPISASPVELFINDNAMSLARWPNESYIDIDSVVDSLTIKCYYNRIKKWKNEKDLWAIGFWKYGWAEHRLSVSSINVKLNSIRFTRKPENGREFTKGRQWYILNCLSELDTSGEYYIDRQLGYLYFILPENIDKEKVKITISHFGGENNSFIKIDSSQYINLQNITFKNTRASGIVISNSNNVTVENCIIQNIGTYAIKLTGENCYLNRLNVFNTGAYGINVEGGDRKKLITANNIIENCAIHSLGRINLTYASYGVSLNGVGNTVKNCEIYDSPHTAIFFAGNYNLIEKNKIHNVCTQTDDAGAIYCGRDWALRGNTIKHNFIYNRVYTE
jgi:hypothetical protein